MINENWKTLQSLQSSSEIWRLHNWLHAPNIILLWNTNSLLSNRWNSWSAQFIYIEELNLFIECTFSSKNGHCQLFTFVRLNNYNYICCHFPFTGGVWHLSRTGGTCCPSRAWCSPPRSGCTSSIPPVLQTFLKLWNYLECRIRNCWWSTSSCIPPSSSILHSSFPLDIYRTQFTICSCCNSEANSRHPP